MNNGEKNLCTQDPILVDWTPIDPIHNIGIYVKPFNLPIKLSPEQLKFLLEIVSVGSDAPEVSTVSKLVILRKKFKVFNQAMQVDKTRTTAFELKLKTVVERMNRMSQLAFANASMI